MTILFIILGALLYLFIGGIISGCIWDSWDEDAGKVATAIFWPFIMLFFGMSFLIMAPVELGHKIKERINKR